MMFLECTSKRILVPRTTENDIIFPFAQLYLKFYVNKKDFEHAKPRVEEAQILSGLKRIEEACHNFSLLKKYRFAFFFSVGLSLFLTLISLVLISHGTRTTNVSSDSALLRLINPWLWAGFGLEAIALIQNAVISVVLAIKARNARFKYEDAVYSVMNQLNEELKEQEVRWKLGKKFRWLEISLDYKKKRMMVDQRKDEPLLNP